VSNAGLSEGQAISDPETGSTDPVMGDVVAQPTLNPDEPAISALANPPVLIPEKPDPSPTELVRNSAPAQSQPTPVTNGAADTVLDERFYVQISSQPSQQAAIESAEEMGRRFASLVGTNQIVIVPANINNRIYYRVRILVSDNATATSLCENYKAAGGNCFVGR